MSSKLVLSPAEIWRDWYGALYVNNDHWEGVPLAAGGRITSPFGIYRPRWGTTHSGIDLGAPLGSAVMAPEAGEVVWANGGPGGFYNENHALGVFIILRHINGWETLYAHMENDSIVHLTGEQVERGATIGRVGVTGNTTGPHVHFMVADQPRSLTSGNPHLRNPEAYLRKTVPMAEGSDSPVTREAEVAAGVGLVVGLNDTQFTTLPVEHRNGYEWHNYIVSRLQGRVTDDDGS